MRRDDASARQVQAADPAASTWLSANAGSGKTRVLTDRVARLLLGGTEPQRILCLTYTTSAASEMQNRLFRRLGEWAMLPEPALRGALTALGVDGPVDADTLARARRLFARAVETPGGLKIQTIHSFCAGLLRRFPLEAGVSPDFSELDDRAARLLRESIAEDMAAGGDQAAFDAGVSVMSGEDIAAFLAELCRNRDGFPASIDRDGVLADFGLPAGFDEARLVGETLAPGDSALLRSLVPLLAGGMASDITAGGRIAAALSLPAGAEMLAALEGVFLYGAKAKAGAHTAKLGDFPRKALREGHAAALMPEIEALMSRVEAGRDRRLALAAAEKTHALHRFASAFLPRYEAQKARAGRLDFDDLISRSARLLSDREVAAWVLFRLDGGIDHILVDEAQDTSPGQWQVIERLADEFTTGESARGIERTIFVVGDKKQSIYSFQGADLAAFDAMRGHFALKYAQIGRAVLTLELEHSFRSSDAILRVVDLTFDERVSRGLGGSPKHIAFHGSLPGRVDIWPLVPKAEDPEPENWFDPVDLLPEDHHNVVLARRIAAEIRRMIDTGVAIRTKAGTRAVHEGDFLILVQRRSDLFHEIIRACKARDLQIAGADRLKIGGELAVKDLTAFLRFLATPEDDLSLAAALRSPLFGWTEGALYGLARPRPPKSFLWTALRTRTDDHAATLAILNDLRDEADYLRPFELLERILTRHGGRERLVARLGAEAEDGIDALLAQALAFEHAEVPSLTGFLAWLDADEVEIKRRLDTAPRAIRVMTVHGAKGLESPIVILPDTAKRRDEVRDNVLGVNGRAVWKTLAEDTPALIAAERAALLERQRDERMRLLYVAMTRAESWLIVCGTGDAGDGAESWHALVADGVEKAGAVDLPTESGIGRRHEHGCWPEPMAAAAPEAPAAFEMPDWARARPAASVATESALSPSALGGAKALPGEGALDEETALRRGTMLHRLLEHLPLWPEPGWPGIAAGLLSGGPESADSAEVEAVLQEARHTLTSPDMAGLLGPGALVEVELTARVPMLGGRLLHGTIDRLLVGNARILAVDYKSNAVVPERPQDVPDGILRQMGAYAAMLEEIYPGHTVETAILWTRTGKLMPLPPEMVRAALAATTIP
ncbi:double-strand break repair helicase AddA [Albidovulum sp.]|uniref:double-strand break repair helicase AddA n=1 Tax=Albidovulum sp. TaxID=1872424 RepID=UPI0039B9B2BD